MAKLTSQLAPLARAAVMWRQLEEVERVGAGEVFLPVGHAVAVGITEGAIVAGWVERVEAVGQFPFVGQAVVVGINGEGALVQLAGGGGGGLPVGGVVGEGGAGDALEGIAGAVRAGRPGRQRRVIDFFDEHLRHKPGDPVTGGTSGLSGMYRATRSPALSRCPAQGPKMGVLVSTPYRPRNQSSMTGSWAGSKPTTSR